MISSGNLSDLFVEVADTLVADFDVVDFLHKLTQHAASISGAGAVGLLLTDQQGALQFMAASNGGAKLLELWQLQSSEGPCMDCFRLRTPIVNADLATAGDRWPDFAPRAVAAGYQSVHAFPMRLREEVIGALNLFGSSDTLFDPEDVRIVQALADVATIAILQERNITRAGLLTEQLQGALNSRVVVEQAKGAVAKLAGVSVEQAFDLLRWQARTTHQRLIDVAHQVLGGSFEAFVPGTHAGPPADKAN